METLRLDKIHLRVGDFSLHGIDFTVNDGEYFILLGPSGAGKSLILELIAGFHKPSRGRVLLKGMDISHQPIQQREVGLLFQDFAIFPHLSVFDNIAFSLRNQNRGRKEISGIIESIATELEIVHLLKRNPQTLSGGEQQRTALARILVRKPSVLLLDEPLASLDVQLRGGIRSLLRRINQQGQTILHVTHDYEEAAILGHSIAVVEKNTIAQCGSHDEVFHHPRSEFIANFVGIRNFFPGQLGSGKNGLKTFSTRGIQIHILTGSEAGKGFAVIRSEDILLSSEPIISSAANNLLGTIISVEPSRIGFEVTIDAGIKLFALVTRESVEKLGLDNGKKIWAGFKASAVRFVPE